MCPLMKLSATMFLAAFLAAGAPAPSITAHTGQVPAPGAPNQQKFESVSGQITANSGKTFTLATSIVHSSSTQQPQPGPKPEPQRGPASHAMTFCVDEKLLSRANLQWAPPPT